MFFNLSFDADGPGAMLIQPKCPALKCYQRINCGTFFKLWSEKCKMLCKINHDILVTMVTKWIGDPYFFFVNIHVWYCIGVFVPNLRKMY